MKVLSSDRPNVTLKWKISTCLDVCTDSIVRNKNERDLKVNAVNFKVERCGTDFFISPFRCLPCKPLLTLASEIEPFFSFSWCMERVKVTKRNGDGMRVEYERKGFNEEVPMSFF